MSRLGEALAPARMGRDFRWLLGSSWLSNVGDGIALAAGPLLVAAQTKDPMLVALATLLQRLPWMLFGLYAGVIADRLDRRRVVVGVNLLRAIVLALLALTIMADAVNVPIVLAAMFILGTAETFADITTGTLLPMLVQRADLGIGNARLMLGNITINRLAGPPIGAALFVTGMVVPFVAQAVTVGLAALLIGQISATVPPPTERGTARSDIAVGVRWLWHHPPLRTLTLAIISFNVTFGAAWSILVLYATERLDMGEIGFGLLSAAGALGGVVGTMIYGSLERRIGMANILRVGLIIETVTHVTLAVTTVPVVALSIFFVFGIHEAAWGTTTRTIRQRAVPNELQGRVSSVYMMAMQGGLVIGAAAGGVIAGVWGITGPFWFGFVGSAVILAVIWRRLALIVDADDAPVEGVAVPIG